MNRRQFLLASIGAGLLALDKPAFAWNEKKSPEQKGVPIIYIAKIGNPSAEKDAFLKKHAITKDQFDVLMYKLYENHFEPVTWDQLLDQHFYSQLEPGKKPIMLVFGSKSVSFTPDGKDLSDETPIKRMRIAESRYPGFKPRFTQELYSQSETGRPTFFGANDEQLASVLHEIAQMNGRLFNGGVTIDRQLPQMSQDEMALSLNNVSFKVENTLSTRRPTDYAAGNYALLLNSVNNLISYATIDDKPSDAIRTFVLNNPNKFGFLIQPVPKDSNEAKFAPLTPLSVKQEPHAYPVLRLSNSPTGSSRSSLSTFETAVSKHENAIYKKPRE